jgi:hypothetical protein
MEAKVKEFYKRFYNHELTDEELYMVFHPSSDAGYYHK